MKKTVFLAFYCAQAMASLSGEAVKDCLGKDFQVQIIHKVFPMGYFSRKFSVVKKKCEIKVYSESYKWIKKVWNIDVCREPIHIKAGSYSVDILKREGGCPRKGSKYCEAFQQIIKLIQDDGLIFAQGEKEDILSEHGKLYCAYALLNKYLSGEEILSRYQDPGPYESARGVIGDSASKKVGAPTNEPPSPPDERENLPPAAVEQKGESI